jgi:hypothetical protein
MANVTEYAKADTKNGKQLLFIISILGGIALIGGFIVNKRKSNLEMQKLNLEIEQMRRDNAKQHPNG